MTLPRRIKLMDSGLARFRCEGSSESASQAVIGALTSKGGKVGTMDDGTLLLDYSDLFTYRYINASVEPESSESLWSAVFKEGNCPRALTVAASAVLAVGSTVAAAIWLQTWAAVAVGIASTFIFLYINYFPRRSCVRRMQRIIETINKPQ